MAPSKKCKRMTVYAMGMDAEGNIEFARNGNKTVMGCFKDMPGRCGCEHAEALLLRRMPHPVSVSVSHSPCLGCARRLVNAGVKTVSFLKAYRISDGVKYLKENGVEVIEVG